MKETWSPLQRPDGPVPHHVRFHSPPTFLFAQTLIVAIWITLNSTGFARFDVYPFILLNLAFSLQAAYAAPLILLAQTRQADRDKAHSEADAQHREALATASEERQTIALRQSEQLIALVEQKTGLTRLTQRLSERIAALTAEIHRRLVEERGSEGGQRECGSS